MWSKFKYIFMPLILLCSSCSWFLGEIDDQEVVDLHKDMRAVTRETPFTRPLRELGIMIKAYYIPKTPVQSKNIGNQTGEKNLPGDLYTMIASAVNKIGPQVVFVPYDVQYVIAESTTGGQITRLYPKVVISGGITGFDKDMIEKSRELEAAGGWGGGQGGGKMDAEAHHSRITLDLNMLDYHTQSYFPGTGTSNSIMLTRDKFGWGVYGYYMGNGASFDYGIKHKQGVHAALRTLVEFSVLELLGKYFEVPYWRCIDGAKPDKAFIALIKEKFLDKSPTEQNICLKKMLMLHGYRGINPEKTTFNSAEDGAVSKAMSICKASNPADTYIWLWENVPIREALGIVRAARRREKETERRRIAEERKNAAARAEQEKKLQEQAQKEQTQKLERYKRHMAEGNRLFNEKKYKEALVQYKKANALFSREERLVQMIHKLNSLLEQEKTKELETKKILQTAGKAYRKAETESFSYNNYSKSLALYKQALAMQPGNAYIKEQIKKINNKLSKYKTVLQSNTQDTEEW